MPLLVKLWKSLQETGTNATPYKATAHRLGILRLKSSDCVDIVPFGCPSVWVLLRLGASQFATVDINPLGYHYVRELIRLGTVACGLYSAWMLHPVDAIMFGCHYLWILIGVDAIPTLKKLWTLLLLGAIACGHYSLWVLFCAPYFCTIECYSGFALCLWYSLLQINRLIAILHIKH